MSASRAAGIVALAACAMGRRSPPTQPSSSSASPPASSAAGCGRRGPRGAVSRSRPARLNRNRGRHPRCLEAASRQVARRSRPARAARRGGARRNRLHRLALHHSPRILQPGPGGGRQARDLRRLGDRRAGRGRDPRARRPSRIAGAGPLVVCPDDGAFATLTSSPTESSGSLPPELSATGTAFPCSGPLLISSSAVLQIPARVPGQRAVSTPMTSASSVFAVRPSLSSSSESPCGQRIAIPATVAMASAMTMYPKVRVEIDLGMRRRAGRPPSGFVAARARPWSPV